MNCTKLRRILIQHGTLNINTGQTDSQYEEWVIQACGVPLFSAAEQESGTCRSCAGGWTHPHNYPADGPPPTTESEGGET